MSYAKRIAARLSTHPKSTVRAGDTRIVERPIFQFARFVVSRATCARPEATWSVVDPNNTTLIVGCTEREAQDLASKLGEGFATRDNIKCAA